MEREQVRHKNNTKRESFYVTCHNVVRIALIMYMYMADTQHALCLMYTT